MLSVRLTEQAGATYSLCFGQRFCIGTSPQKKANSPSRNKHKKSPYRLARGFFVTRHRLHSHQYSHYIHTYAHKIHIRNHKCSCLSANKLQSGTYHHTFHTNICCSRPFFSSFHLSSSCFAQVIASS